jgi:hypothetical protein
VNRSILTTGLVGATSAGTTAVALVKAGAPWQAVVLAVIVVVMATIAVVIALIAALILDVVSLRLTLGVVYRLIDQRYPGLFKGPWDVVLKGPTVPAGPGPAAPQAEALGTPQTTARLLAILGRLGCYVTTVFRLTR